MVAHAQEEGPVVQGTVLEELDGEVRVLDVGQGPSRHRLQVHRAHGAVSQRPARPGANLPS